MPMIQPLASSSAETSTAVEPMSVCLLITTTEKPSRALKMIDGVIQITGDGPLATCLKESKTWDVVCLRAILGPGVQVLET